MPDLTIESGWWCKSNEYWEYRVPGSKHPKSYIVRWERDFSPHSPYEYHYTCECEGYKFRQKCKHIEIAKAKHCRWNEEMSPGVQPDPGPSCPSCGGEVSAFRVAV